MFHNTTKEDGQLLIEYEKKAMSQEQLILDFFRRWPEAMMTPFQVKKFVDLISGSDVPITSIRRAMTDLTKAGKLIRTNRKTVEKYARPNYYWTLNTNLP
jgi:hypothetical protein